MVHPQSRVSKVRVSGPLGPYADEFRSMLEESGYAPLTIVNHLRLMKRVSGWMETGGYEVADLSGELLDDYLADARAAGRVAMCSPGDLVQLCRVLGVAPAPGSVQAPVSAAASVLVLFESYLRTERALAQSTISAYVLRAARFLDWCAPEGDLRAVGAGEISGAVLRESRNVSVGSAQFFVAALRSFLRFCFVQGLMPADLSAAALSVTGRRRSTVPLGISTQDAAALLGACDRRKAAGRRDYAVILLLLRLGLRAGEVAGLMLEDIDWRAAEIIVHGKGRRDERLPLPRDVGEAIVGYLKSGRPATTSRAVFVRKIAPIQALGRGGISFIVRHASQRAGLAPMGAHRLRHTLACDMVAAGVPLPEISQVLRHRSNASTTNYARVDIQTLHGLALPWPGGDQ